jgi:hypothetical protein
MAGDVFVARQEPATVIDIEQVHCLGLYSLPGRVHFGEMCLAIIEIIARQRPA